MSVKRVSLTSVLLVALAILIASALPSLAQPSASPSLPAQDPPPAGLDALPPAPGGYPPMLPAGDPHAGPIQTAEGLWVMPAGALEAMSQAAQSPQSSGGPDEFGYTWNDAVSLNWIDVSGGIGTGINNSVDHAGPFNIGFPFKYYENTRSQIYVSRHGFLAFNDTYLSNRQSRVPSSEQPNDVIAPHWVPVDRVNGYVRYQRGGTAPNRWFVVEWNRLLSECCSDPAEEYTFQAILHENGNIVFQYATMTVNGGYLCQATGIEDSTGLDGLSITEFCRPVASNHAVRITRPAPAARVRIFPQHYGAFIYPGQISLTEIPIRNTGDLGADIYDLELNISWAAGLYHADGVTPLTDTNNNGLLDTGPVSQGQTKTVIIKVWSSASAPIGNHSTATLTARSSLDPGKRKTATSRIAVPTSFAQAYSDDADGAMSTMLVKPQAQAVRKATPDWHRGNDVAVAELPNHNQLHLWRRGRCLDTNCNRYAYEIEYTILDPYGETVYPVAKLTDHSGAAFSTYDYPAGVAAAPDGQAGVVWYRYLWNSGTGQFNYNIYWAALDTNGNVAVGPRRVTNNAAWGSGSDLNVPRFYNPRIAATDNDRFVLAWDRRHQESAGWVEDIWYAVLDHTGGVVRSPTRLTNGSAGSFAHNVPALASLASNRTFISWITHRNADEDIFFAVLDSDGGLVKAATNLSVDETVVDWNNHDAVQLSGGKILAVWEAWGCFPGEWVPRIRYVLLDSAYNRIGTPICLGKAEAAYTGDRYVSVTSAAANRAVLTWMDNSNRRNLYYALVNANGVVVTPPMIFQTSKALSPYIFSSYQGYGNTTYTWTPPAGVDSELSATPAVGYAVPGGAAPPIQVKLTGRGGLPATSVRLTATLDPQLSYVSDTSGVTPVVSGQTVTWNLPDLRLFDVRQFQVTFQTTGGNLGDLLPIQLQLSSAEPDLTPNNNAVMVQVTLVRINYLPLVSKR